MYLRARGFKVNSLDMESMSGKEAGFQQSNRYLFLITKFALELH